MLSRSSELTFLVCLFVPFVLLFGFLFLMSLRVVWKPQPATNPLLHEILSAAMQNGVLYRSCLILLPCPLMLGVEPLKQTTVLLRSTSALWAAGVGM